MRTQAKVLAHSVNPAGCELLTFQLRLPRILLSQLNTYKTLAVSARSSRAVPTEKLIREVEEHPFVPAVWRHRQKGMTAGAVMADGDARACAHNWLFARDEAVVRAKDIARLGAAKEHVNRLLEPFAWAWAVVTGSRPRVEHLIRQRTADDAQPEFRELAGLMRDALGGSTPLGIEVGGWHLPYVTRTDLTVRGCGPQLSAARSARVSYTPFDSDTADYDADLDLYDRLRADGHHSPLEHPAMATATELAPGKYAGFIGMRQREGY